MIVKREGYEPFAISLRYGQRHAVEIATAEQLVANTGVDVHVNVEIGLRQLGSSALTSDTDVPKKSSVEDIELGATYSRSRRQPASPNRPRPGSTIVEGSNVFLSSPLKKSTGCDIARMRWQNSDVSRYSVSRAELGSARAPRAEKCHDGIFPPGS